MYPVGFRYTLVRLVEVKWTNKVPNQPELAERCIYISSSSELISWEAPQSYELALNPDLHHI
jgi:hypothetical protein